MFVLVHLSDIHIHGELDSILPRSALVGAAIASHAVDAEMVVIAVTGDIAYSGTAAQYELALIFLKSIEEKIKSEKDVEVRFVTVPGNHDCDFSGDQDLRNLVLKQLAESSGGAPSPQLSDVALAVQESYFNFMHELTGIAPVGIERLRYVITMRVGDEDVHFDCLNLAWVSQLRENKITFPSNIIPDQKQLSGCVVTLLHHPFNWLHPSTYRDFRRRVRSNSDFVLSGHEHQWNIIETDEREAGKSLQFEGSVLQDSHSEVSGFGIVEVDLVTEKYRAFLYSWTGSHYERGELGNWSGYRKFQLTPPADSWVFTERFRGELSDLGVALRVGDKEYVSLEDIFVFPDLEASTSENEDSTTLHGGSLIEEEANSAGFLLQGDERSGRTCLLKDLTRRYFAAGMVPLLCPSALISRATESEIDKLLGTLVSEQYQGKTPDEYRQLSIAKKVLVIDDFDEVPIKSEKARKQLLCRLRQQCSVLVLAVSDVFEVSQLVGEDDGDVLEQLPRYRILPFGRLCRARLISRWVTLDSDEFLDEDERIRRVDEATKIVELVMRRKLVPCYPVYLLTLLQAIKGGTAENFKDSGLGDYYQYLISDAMLEAGVRKEDLTEVDQYCTQLAWHLRKLNRNYLSKNELGEFDDWFTYKWVKADYAGIRERLSRARILGVTGDVIEFRYAYILYFYVAKYLADNFDDPDVQQFVEASAQQLYVRSRANILIFLTHFTNSPAVIDAIIKTLNDQFDGVPLAQFNLRNESVEAMLRQLPQLVYEGGDPLDRREEEARYDDRAENKGSDGLVEQPENGVDLSLSAKLTTVFKTIEILGQILRTQYAKIERVRRQEIIKDMINGPLRALEVFYDSLRHHPDTIVAQFESELEESGKVVTADGRKALAQRIVASIVLGVSFGFFRKIAEAVGAESIKDDLRAVVRDHNELGHWLVALAAALDGQRPIPRVDIEYIQRAGEGSLIVDKIVQVLVIYHMYMYRTTYADIRWAHDVLKIPSNIKMRTMLTGGATTSE